MAFSIHDTNCFTFTVRTEWSHADERILINETTTTTYGRLSRRGLNLLFLFMLLGQSVTHKQLNVCNEKEMSENSILVSVRELLVKFFSTDLASLTLSQLQLRHEQLSHRQRLQGSRFFIFS